MPLFLLVVAVVSFVIGALLALFHDNLGQVDLAVFLFFAFLGLACQAAAGLPFWTRRP